jgi:hypothetical protein
MSDERLQRIEEAVSRIERGMFGDEELKFPGIIATQENHGHRLSRLEMWVFRVGVSVAAGGTVLGVVYKLAVDWVKG